MAMKNLSNEKCELVKFDDLVSYYISLLHRLCYYILEITFKFFEHMVAAKSFKKSKHNSDQG